jgi:hypothetical protein
MQCAFGPETLGKLPEIAVLKDAGWITDAKPVPFAGGEEDR